MSRKNFGPLYFRSPVQIAISKYLDPPGTKMFEIYGPPSEIFYPPYKNCYRHHCVHLKGGQNISAEIIDPQSILSPALVCYENIGPPIIVLPQNDARNNYGPKGESRYSA